MLDNVFREDESRVGEDFVPEHIAMLRYIALSLLKTETPLKRRIKKRLKSEWDENYLLKVLGIVSYFICDCPVVVTLNYL